MKSRHLAGLCMVVVTLAITSLQIDNELHISGQLRLILTPGNADDFDRLHFVYAQLPRMCMTVLVGAMLGLTGSLMQQLTQNCLTSPLTLGTSSGAWLALIIVNIWFPNLISDYSALAAMTGAMLSFGFIVLIAGAGNMAGMPLVVSGMVVNILLGSIAAAMVLLNEAFAQNIFMWGAGDLAQNGWEQVLWLLPRLSPAFVVLLFGPRLLSLMRLGHMGAAGRGLSVVPTFLILMLIGIWLVSASITIVGIIGFIGLLSPNIARTMGAGSARMELYSSLLLGAALLLATDIISVLASRWGGEVIPSGITAAAIGAPALIWFARKELKAQDRIAFQGSRFRPKPNLFTFLGLLTVLIFGLILYIFVQTDGDVWCWGIPGLYQWQLRWPRLLTALFAGAGLAVAGCILQRLIYNPLASPDILGVSSGATFALVFAGLFFNHSMLHTRWATAFIGSFSVLIILLLLGKRHQYAPSVLILTGIAITALLEALIQFCMARGTADSYQILLWLSGSTYRVTPSQSLLLAATTGILILAAFGISRWLTLISIGRGFAFARGLSIQSAGLILLVLVAVICALVTATMGPVSFVGLIAPHMARMLGADQVKLQLGLSLLVGSILMIWADWAGQVVLYPVQIAAGTLVAVTGGIYFLILMFFSRLKQRVL